MELEYDPFCKIFVDTARRWELRDLLAEFAAMEPELRDNKEADARRAQDEGGFLYYPQFVELQKPDAMDPAEYLRGVGDLLSRLWKLGEAVVSCDFEHLLPRSGGYRAGSAGSV